jgi:hypothetical protein
MKGDMEVEVLKDTTAADDAKRARKRYERIAMTAHEASLYCEAPNQANSNDRPGYPDPTYGDTTEG